MKSNDQIAIEQRDYWNAVAKENNDRGHTQQQPGEPALPEDPFKLTARDWAEYWNLQVPGDQRH